MAVDQRELEAQVTGLDALEFVATSAPSRAIRIWRALWPKLAAVVLGLGLWQVVVWTGWKDETILPSPLTVLDKLGAMAGSSGFYEALATTARRAVYGYAVALLIGTLVGLAVARVRLLRVALGALVTGLQTMPSIAWFPLAIVLFKLSESAIMFVVVLGAAPSIANGLIAGVDHVPPLLLRSGRMLGARGLALYRHVIIPASLPSFVAGLKQGWAFAWRSLMAGELLGVVAGQAAVGQQLSFARDLADYPLMMAWMLTILVIGIIADALFGAADGAIRRRRGLVDPAA